jgi:hypothetical protein
MGEISKIIVSKDEAYIFGSMIITLNVRNRSGSLDSINIQVYNNKGEQHFNGNAFRGIGVEPKIDIGSSERCGGIIIQEKDEKFHRASYISWHEGEYHSYVGGNGWYPKVGDGDVKLWTRREINGYKETTVSWDDGRRIIFRDDTNGRSANRVVIEKEYLKIYYAERGITFDSETFGWIKIGMDRFDDVGAVKGLKTLTESMEIGTEKNKTASEIFSNIVEMERIK